MSQKTRSTFVVTDPSEIVQALVGLKDVRVLRYERHGPDVELLIEQVVDVVTCSSCKERAQVKERPVVHYIDLPVYGTPMRLGWKKHRMFCVNAGCPKRSWVLGDHRIAAKNCLLTTRAAKWATVQVGTGRTVNEVAGELGCDWHTVSDAVRTYGAALLEADRKRMNRTSAIGLDETSFVRHSARGPTDYATTVADVEHHQIIEILPSRDFVEVARWLDKQPKDWKQRIPPLRRPRHVRLLCGGLLGRVAQGRPGCGPFPRHRCAPRGAMSSGAGERPTLPGCRSSPVKLRAA